MVTEFAASSLGQMESTQYHRGAAAYQRRITSHDCKCIDDARSVIELERCTYRQGALLVVHVATTDMGIADTCKESMSCLRRNARLPAAVDCR